MIRRSCYTGFPSRFLRVGLGFIEFNVVMRGSHPLRHVATAVVTNVEYILESILVYACFLADIVSVK